MSNNPSQSGRDVAELVGHGWSHVVREVHNAAEVVAGRLSATPLWKLSTGAGEFALRAWQADEQQAARRAGVFALQVGLKGNVEAPQPIAPLQKSGGDYFASQRGQLWELAPWLAGENSFAASPSREKLQSMCHALAKVHQRASQIPTSLEPSDLRGCHSVASHRMQLGRLLEHLGTGAFDAAQVWWQQLVPDASERLPACLRLGAELAQQRLGECEQASLPVQWCWGDAWHNNFLFAGDDVCGVVDFATVRIDTPAADLARLLGSTTADHPDWWAGGIEAYGAVCPLSPAQQQAAAALAASGTVLSLANWLRWICLESRTFRDPGLAQQRLLHFARRLTNLLRGDGSTSIR